MKQSCGLLNLGYAAAAARLSVIGEGTPSAVLYDHREERCGIPRALRAAGITATATQLPAGDYVLSDRVVVERKTGADLAASIKDRRPIEQVDRLTQAYDAVVLVVEGEPIHIGQASWKGALARVLQDLPGRSSVSSLSKPIAPRAACPGGAIDGAAQPAALVVIGSASSASAG